MKLSLLMVTFAATFPLITTNVGNTSPQLAQLIDCSYLTTYECRSQQAEAAERKLNQVYQQLRAKLASQQRQKLTQAQLNWIKFRDTTCEYERDEVEGRISTEVANAYLYCSIKLTEQRIADLQSSLDRL